MPGKPEFTGFFILLDQPGSGLTLLNPTWSRYCHTGPPIGSGSGGAILTTLTKLGYSEILNDF